MIAQLKFKYNEQPVSLFLNDYHLMAEMMKENNFYEHWLLEFIAKHFKGGTFVDVGANTGNHTVFFAKFCESDKVIAVEPLQASALQLGLNIIDNDLEEKVQVLTVAISNQEGKGFMTVPNPKEQSIGGTFLSGGIGEPTMINTLDNLLSMEEKITLIKIDVEGHEVQAVQGGLTVIEKHKPDLFIETFSNNKLQFITELLQPFGYEMKERYCYAPVYHFSTRSDIKRTFK